MKRWIKTGKVRVDTSGQRDERSVAYHSRVVVGVAGRMIVGHTDVAAIRMILDVAAAVAQWRSAVRTGFRFLFATNVSDRVVIRVHAGHAVIGWLRNCRFADRFQTLILELLFASPLAASVPKPRLHNVIVRLKSMNKRVFRFVDMNLK